MLGLQPQISFFVTKEGALWIVNTKEWIEEKLVPADDEPEDLEVAEISWSPNGKWLAYVTRELKEPEKEEYEYYETLWYIQVDTGKKIKLLSRAGGMILATWSDDGNYILFWPSLLSASLLADGTWLMIISVSDGKPRTITPAMLAYSDFLDVSPDGKFLAATIGGGRESWSNKTIALIELSTGSLTYLTDKERTSALSPVFSPDGKRIAYVAGPTIQGKEVFKEEVLKEKISKRRIWIMNSDGSNKHQLTPNENYHDERPLWSADGDWILFARLDQNNQASLWLMASDSSKIIQVVEKLTLVGSSYYGHIEWENSFDWWRGEIGENNSAISH